jgi:hypothetical protein
MAWLHNTWDAQLDCISCQQRAEAHPKGRSALIINADWQQGQTQLGQPPGRARSGQVGRCEAPAGACTGARLCPPSALGTPLSVPQMQGRLTTVVTASKRFARR